MDEIGTGNVYDEDGSGRAANAMHFGYNYSGDATVREQRGFVAWPPAGYVPSQTVWGRWSFQLIAQADFTRATVSVTDDYGPIPVNVINRAGAFVWAVHGDRNSREFPRFPDRDYCYRVTISNVTVAGTAQTPFQYVTCLIDPGNESESRGRYLSPPVWSPDGTQIAYTNNGIWIADTDGTGQQQLSK